VSPAFAAGNNKAAKTGRGLGVYATLAYAFLHLPLVTLIVFSFNASRFTLWEGFSLRWYRAVFTDPEMADAAWTSVVVAIVSTAISTIVGTLAAYALWKRRSRLLSGSLYLSLVTPEIVTGVSLLALFQWAFSMAQLAARFVYGDSRARFIFHRLRGHRCLGAAAHARSGA